MVYNVFSKLICILVMAEGGYDPTETIPPFPETGDDDNDDNWDPLPSPPPQLVVSQYL